MQSTVLCYVICVLWWPKVASVALSQANAPAQIYAVVNAGRNSYQNLMSNIL
jgi:hypothetical protein